jgi:hypothetical protein
LKVAVVVEALQGYQQNQKKKLGENGKRPPSVDIPLQMEGQTEGRWREKMSSWDS